MTVGDTSRSCSVSVRDGFARLFGVTLVRFVNGAGGVQERMGVTEVARP